MIRRGRIKGQEVIFVGSPLAYRIRRAVTRVHGWLRWLRWFVWGVVVTVD